MFSFVLCQIVKIKEKEKIVKGKQFFWDPSSKKQRQYIHVTLGAIDWYFWISNDFKRWCSDDDLWMAFSLKWNWNEFWLSYDKTWLLWFFIIFQIFTIFHEFVQKSIEEKHVVLISPITHLLVLWFTCWFCGFLHRPKSTCI